MEGREKGMSTGDKILLVIMGSVLCYTGYRAKTEKMEEVQPTTKKVERVLANPSTDISHDLKDHEIVLSEGTSE